MSNMTMDTEQIDKLSTFESNAYSTSPIKKIRASAPVQPGGGDMGPHPAGLG